MNLHRAVGEVRRRGRSVCVGDLKYGSTPGASILYYTTTSKDALAMTEPVSPAGGGRQAGGGPRAGGWPRLAPLSARREPSPPPDFCKD
ncbi:hypothetical protein EVAR_61106_1 [Eumeta japonica]|uniref:Uncharacterized protein n=1 Tax=Eumeta variegata TaxID=151549 RepID=A0A4C1YQE0_EUMVA|nr:hypothetical protein EVAR_61106_1 [Eumeta japonica]